MVNPTDQAARDANAIPSEPQVLTGREGAGWLALAVLANLAFLHPLWRRADHYGIWDWDFSAALMEAGRRSLVDFGQVPLWNPWMGGGNTLVGHPLGAVFSPSFLPVWIFGTVIGLKVCIGLYLLIAQVGTFRLGRRYGLEAIPAAFAALIFSWGGVFAQHLAHGHIGWIGYAWLPFVLLALHRTRERLAFPALAAGGLFVALSWLDGGAYHYVLVPLLAGLYALALAIEWRTLRPMLAVATFGVFALALSAVELVPVAEMILQYPRKTGLDNNFYGAPFEPSFFGLLHQAFLSRQQAHTPDAWMPYVLNVGAYVGLLPLVLAAIGVALRPRRAAPFAALFFVTLWICLGPSAPIDLWALLHRLPALDSMQIPMRARILPLLCLGLLAGIGLQAFLALPALAGRARVVAAALLAFVALDLFLVNGPVYEVAAAVPPIEVTPRADFVHRANSPHLATYERSAIRPIWPNWPTASFPSIRENVGILYEFWPLIWPKAPLAFDHPRYPGAEAVGLRPGVEVRDVEITPNRITVRVSGPGKTVVVNQNYHAGWKVAEGALGVVPHLGRIAVAGVPPGESSFTLVFQPLTFRIGAGVSLAAALGLLVGAWLTRRGGR